MVFLQYISLRCLSSYHRRASLAFACMMLALPLLMGVSASQVYAQDATITQDQLIEARDRSVLELKNKEAQIRQLKSVLNDKDDELENLQAQLSAQELLLREKDILHAEIAAMEKEIQKKDDQIDVVKGNLSYQQGREAELQSLMNEMQKMMDEHAVLKEQALMMQQSPEALDDMEQQIKAAKAEKKQIEANMKIVADERAALAQQLHELRDVRLVEALNTISAQDLKIQELQTQSQAWQVEKQTMEENAVASQMELAYLQDKLQAAQAEISSIAQSAALAQKSAGSKPSLSEVAASEVTDAEKVLDDTVKDAMAEEASKAQDEIVKAAPQISDVSQAAAQAFAQTAQNSLSEAQKMEMQLKGGDAMQAALRGEQGIIPSSQASILESVEQTSVPQEEISPAVPLPALLQTAQGYLPETLAQLETPPDINALVYQWHENPTFSVAEQRLAQGESFDDIAVTYLQKMENRCTGEFSAVPDYTGDVSTMRIDSYDVACIVGGEQKSAMASLLFFEEGDVFTVISHETVLDFAEQAMDKRDQLLSALQSL